VNLELKGKHPISRNDSLLAVFLLHLYTAMFGEVGTAQAINLLLKVITVEEIWFKSVYMKEFWDQRYRQEGFAYGRDPNAYFKEKLGDFTAANMLLPAEGEGRNAVYAARQGWSVFAFDLSEEGKKKALQLAEDHGVGLDYRVGDLSQMDYNPEQFDLIGLVYAHFPQTLRSAYHKKTAKWLKKGGVLVLEAFGKKHLDYVTKNPAVGGPKDLDLLYSLEEIKRDFEGFEYLELREGEVELNEGLYHRGLGWVIRALIRRPD
jgi:hypothetical protein